jgi:arsenite-transporting ATPase
LPQIHVYEPALCCTTGVCGPDLDAALVTFTADLDHVVRAGGQAQRHNLANDPRAFVESEPARSFLHVSGSNGLPLTLVDDVTALTGRYPTREELLGWAGIAAADDSPRAGADPDRVDLGLTVSGSVGRDCSGDTGCC